MRTLIKILETIGANFSLSGQRLHAGPAFWFPPIKSGHDVREGSQR